MANQITSGIWLIDTPSANPLTTELMVIQALKWVSAAGSPGDVAVIQDATGHPIWQSICSGVNFDTGVFTLGSARTVQGLLVPTLGSGQLYIYTR